MYLYLALACFLGIVLIFVLDGYTGRYDKLEFDTGQRVQSIDFVENDERTPPFYMLSIHADRGDVLEFTYTLENRWFGRYQADVLVLLTGNSGATELVNGRLSVDGFSTGILAWTIDTATLLPANTEERVIYNAELVIKRGGIERVISMNINTNSTGIKPLPLPAAE